MNPGKRQAMSKKDNVELEGRIMDMRGSKFLVHCDNDLTVTAVHSGRLRRHRVRAIVGDRVRIRVSPYDLSNGLIVRRLET